MRTISLCVLIATIAVIVVLISIYGGKKTAGISLDSSESLQFWVSDSSVDIEMPVFGNLRRDSKLTGIDLVLTLNNGQTIESSSRSNLVVSTKTLKLRFDRLDGSANTDDEVVVKRMTGQIRIDNTTIHIDRFF